MKFPCEIIVWKVLPCIKCQMAMQMKEKGLTQKEIANMLNVTEAAVSLYLSGKRAKDFKLKEVNKEIKEASDKVLETPELFSCCVCDICKKVRSEGLLCQSCIDTGTPYGCSICKEVK